MKEGNSLEQIDLKVQIRKTIGNGPARLLRRQGRIPAVLYGPKIEPVLLSIDNKDFEHLLKESSVGSVLLNLQIQNGKTYTRSAMIKELQTHPVSGKFLHVDFYEVDLLEKITAKVPIVARGTSAGVEVGGLLQYVRRELEVLCLPTAIPEAIEVDISDLDIGDSIHVEDISLAGDIEILAETNFTLVTVLAPKVEEVVEEEELLEGEELEEGEEAAEEAAGEEASSEEAKED
jgi:large subunit ribosomal protein L25